MKLVSSAIEMQSTHVSMQQFDMRERLDMWRSGNQQAPVPTQQVRLSTEGLAAQQAEATQGIDAAEDTDPRLSVLIRMIEFLTGRPVKVMKLGDLQNPSPTEQPQGVGSGGTKTPQAGFGSWRWIDDESNVDQRYSRNFLRHAVLPGLTARFPAAEVMLAQAAGHFAEANELLGDLAALDWQALAGDGDSAAIKALRTLPLPRLKNLLRWRLRELGWRAPVAARLDEFARQLLSAAPDRHPSLNLPDGQMRVAGRHLHWFPVA